MSCKVVYKPSRAEIKALEVAKRREYRRKARERRLEASTSKLGDIPGWQEVRERLGKVK